MSDPEPRNSPAEKANEEQKMAQEEGEVTKKDAPVNDTEDKKPVEDKGTGQEDQTGSGSKQEAGDEGDKEVKPEETKDENQSKSEDKAEEVKDEGKTEKEGEESERRSPTPEYTPPDSADQSQADTEPQKEGMNILFYLKTYRIGNIEFSGFANFRALKIKGKFAMS